MKFNNITAYAKRIPAAAKTLALRFAAVAKEIVSVPSRQPISDLMDILDEQFSSRGFKLVDRPVTGLEQYDPRQLTAYGTNMGWGYFFYRLKEPEELFIPLTFKEGSEPDRTDEVRIGVFRHTPSVELEKIGEVSFALYVDNDPKARAIADKIGPFRGWSFMIGYNRIRQEVSSLISRKLYVLAF